MKPEPRPLIMPPDIHNSVKFRGSRVPVIFTTEGLITSTALTMASLSVVTSTRVLGVASPRGWGITVGWGLSRIWRAAT